MSLFTPEEICKDCRFAVYWYCGDEDCGQKHPNFHYCAEHHEEDVNAMQGKCSYKKMIL